MNRELESKADPALLAFERVSVQLGDKTVLQDITLSIGAGEHVAILGPNGCGKSTLIKTITRECYPLSLPGSSLTILGRDTWNVFELRPLLGIVSNELMRRCTREITGHELVLSGFFSSIGVQPYHHVTPAMLEKTEQVLQLLEIPHLAHREITELSSGEAHRLLIGRALVHDPLALLLDEPSNSLDFRAAIELRDLLRKLAQAGHHSRDGTRDLIAPGPCVRGRLQERNPHQRTAHRAIWIAGRADAPRRILSLVLIARVRSPKPQLKRSDSPPARLSAS
jgi:iron complex transport system ATP-binding protein